ncbi:MAG: peptidylprolyl isomerase [Cyclobacteriaceae bacterium]
MKYTLYSLLLIAMVSGCTPATFKSRWLKKEAPEEFRARFETTKGNFDIIAKREWSPLAVDRLYQLIQYEYFNETPIYRVVDNFVAQFGQLDTLQTYQWRKYDLEDEPVVEKNLEGTMAFARAGKKTRGTQLFINLKSNSPRLDNLKGDGVTGFPVIAKVTSGMDVVKEFTGYGDQPRQKLKQQENVNEFLKENFPEIDFITKAYILKK